MTPLLKNYMLLCFTALSFFCSSQNENKKWYFGSGAGLDFTTVPPAILSSGTMSTSEGCASVADATGNLLFYTDGVTIYNSAHVPMANGTGLLGFASSTQGAFIVRQPGFSNIYFVFTQGASSNGLRYSIVDMSLAAGAGSVTIKNIVLSATSSEKLTGAKHCNGMDTWVITHDQLGTNYSAFLVTAAGVNTTAVVSSVGTSYSGIDYIGCLKISPNGKKLAAALYGTAAGYELYDFDNITGIISNPLSLAGFTLAYGVEFSPDGTKLYGSKFANANLCQWDLCAGSPTAIAASVYTVTGSGAGKGQLQLAPNGKIYVARMNQSDLGVINNPNGSGSGCSYVETGQSIAPKISTLGLPNFITSLPKPVQPPFTYTSSSCQSAYFSASLVQTYTTVGCSSSGYSITGIQWNFGNPASGASNTSTLTNPMHYFTNLGSYTVSLVVYYNCGGGIDTMRQVVNVNQPCVSITSTSITCASLGSATVAATGGIGPFSYTWMPTAQTSSVATGLTPGTYTLTIFDFGANTTNTVTTTFNTLVPLTGQVVNGTVSCFGASTATAGVVNLSGGSGAQTYLWSNGLTTYTNGLVMLSAGVWSVTVSDALTACHFTQQINVAQAPAATLNVSASSPTACVGTPVVLTGTNSGGTPGYTYTWTAGPAAATQTVNPSTGGTYIYTLVSTDANMCLKGNTISVNFISAPVLTVSSVSICPLQTGTLTASGATSYTWNSVTPGASFTASPASTTGYTVTGSASGCTASATASIVLKPVPVATLSSNSPVCQGQGLQLSGNGGSSYSWTGPQIFTSALQNPSVSVVAVNQGGTYNVTVTAANSCTAAAGISTTVYPTPVISVNSGSLCEGQSFTFQPAGAATYTISGGAAIITPALSGTYLVTGTSSQGCLSGSVTSTVTVQAGPTLAVNSGSVCAGALFTLTPSGAFTYTLPGNNPVVTPTTGLNYYTVNGTSAAGCAGSAVISTVTAYANPTVTVNSGSICAGQSFTIVPAGAVTYTIAGGLPVVTPTNSMNYYLITGTSTEGCSDTAMSTVIVMARPVIAATAVHTLICAGETATLLASGAASYTWNTAATASLITVTPSVSTVYSVTGTGANGCMSGAIAAVTQSVSTCDDIRSYTDLEGTRLYPNPNQGSFMIACNTGGYKQVSITDVSGRVVFTSGSSEEKIAVDLSAFSKGVYYVSMTLNNRHKAFKVIVH